MRTHPSPGTIFFLSEHICDKQLQSENTNLAKDIEFHEITVSDGGRITPKASDEGKSDRQTSLDGPKKEKSLQV